jgi:predicted DNA-binding protein
MPAKNPRINVVLEEPLYRQVKLMARKEGVSLSTKVRDLIKESLETQEDIFLAGVAEDRSQSWNDANTLSHDEVWK